MFLVGWMGHVSGGELFFTSRGVERGKVQRSNSALSIRLFYPSKIAKAIRFSDP